MQLSETVLKTRTSFLEGDRKRDEDKRPPEDVERYCDIPYGTDTVWQLLDLYRPKCAAGKKLPVIVSIHGGGWVYGSKAIYQFYGMSLAERGFAMVNFTYRLAPEYMFPAALEDTNLVMQWIIDHQDVYGLDPANVFAVGDSAGGNYLGLYAAFLTNPVYAARFDFKAPEGLVLRGCGLNCGYYDALSDPENALFKELLDPEGKCTTEDLDVLSKITPDFPPSYAMSANGDFLKTHVPRIIDVLKKNGVFCESKIYGSDEETLYHVFHVDVAKKAAGICNDDECAFFRKLIS